MEEIPEKNYAFLFRLKDGSRKGILAGQVTKWQEAYPVINVHDELRRIEADSNKKPFLDKGYFFQIPQMLGKIPLKQ